MKNTEILLGNDKLEDWGVFASFYDPTDDSSETREVEILLSEGTLHEIFELIKKDIESGEVSSIEVDNSVSLF